MEIKVLNTLTASKIAAGEVVERPINVVKELVENALDAEATRITVELVNGGVDLIRVTDNGKGIPSLELPLAIERYATSKAVTVEDVYNISTFGFRGEALAAISSVSNFSIKSYRVGDEPSELVSEFGLVSPVRPAAINIGTQVSVAKIFDNLPVRKKYLKSKRSNENDISKFLKQLSLFNSNIEIIVLFDNKEVYRTHASSSMLDVAKDVFSEGRVVFAESKYKDAQSGSDTVVRVCTTHPAVHRRRRDSIFIGVNGRVVRDPSLMQAVIQAYHRILPNNIFPMSAVDIKITPSAVDVNVHPAKSEVRFVSPSILFSQVKNTTEKAIDKFTMVRYEDIEDDGVIETYPEERLNSAPQLMNRGLMEKGAGEGVQTSLSADAQDYRSTANLNRNSTNKSFRGVNANRNSGLKGGADSLEMFKSMRDALNIDKLDVSNDIQKSYKRSNLDSKEDKQSPLLKDEADVERNPLMANAINEELSPVYDLTKDLSTVISSVTDDEFQLELNIAQESCYKVIGQLANTYIICEGPNSDLVVIDQHVAHERILYNKYRNADHTLPSMTLFEPIVITVTPEEILYLEDVSKEFAGFGYSYELFGINDIKITRVPVSILKRDVSKEFMNIVHDSMDLKRSRKTDSTILTMSCRNAVMAGERLSLHEMQQLVDTLVKTESHQTCPHGRPIVYSFAHSELAKKFLR